MWAVAPPDSARPLKPGFTGSKGAPINIVRPYHPDQTAPRARVALLCVECRRLLQARVPPCHPQGTSTSEPHRRRRPAAARLHPAVHPRKASARPQWRAQPACPDSNRSGKTLTFASRWRTVYHSSLARGRQFLPVSSCPAVQSRPRRSGRRSACPRPPRRSSGARRPAIRRRALHTARAHRIEDGGARARAPRSSSRLPAHPQPTRTASRAPPRLPARARLPGSSATLARPRSAHRWIRLNGPGDPCPESHPQPCPPTPTPSPSPTLSRALDETPFLSDAWRPEDIDADPRWAVRHTHQRHAMHMPARAHGSTCTRCLHAR